MLADKGSWLASLEHQLVTAVCIGATRGCTLRPSWLKTNVRAGERSAIECDPAVNGRDLRAPFATPSHQC